VVFIPISDDNPLRSIPFQWVTISLLAANAIVFTLGSMRAETAAIASFALIPSELFGVQVFGGPAPFPSETLHVPEALTLITYQFMHGDIFHLLSNMLFLWVFGDNVEDAMGHLKFLAFYLVCGVAGGLAHALLTLTPSVPLVGASGAVAGVIAAYLMLHPRVRVWVLAFRFIPLRIPAAWVLGVWVVTQFIMVLLPDIGPVAWWAHIGGMVAGAVLILFLRRPGVALFDRGLQPTAVKL
jgi:membrane associated rhomboid family serine protease